jgi:hypothetical protein
LSAQPEQDQQAGALPGISMPRKQESKWNLEELTDTDICVVIHYLDPHRIPETNGENHSALLMTCFWVLFTLLGSAGFLWL